MKKRVFIIFASVICARAQNSYSVHRLVSDLPGMAEHVDANLKNPWGLSASGSSPFWISNNHTGTTTVYNSDGNPFPDGNPLIVTIPAPAGGGANQASSPTGQTFNDTGSFELAPGKPATFLFCAEDGTISGWNGSASPNALNVVDNSASGAVYKGVAVARGSDGPGSMPQTSAPGPSMHSTERSIPCPFRTRCEGQTYRATRHSISNGSASACMSLMPCGMKTATRKSPEPETGMSLSSRWKAILCPV